MRLFHGYSKSRLYITYCNMKRRCLNPTPKESRTYKNIVLCEEWHKFIPFLKWALEHGYKDNLTIDRKDNDKGYSPDNCRFVDYNIQNANKGLSPKNTTGYIGVCPHNKYRYRAVVQWEGEQILSEFFDTALEAAVRRDNFVKDNELPHTLNFT